MRAIVTVALFAALPTGSLAQTFTESRYERAPWWMDQPIIASTGHVKIEMPANRATFSATFQVVAKTTPDATRAAADKVRELGHALSSYGQSKVTTQTTFNMRPIYDQYRDKEGNLIANQRADKIDAYEVNANVSVSVYDVAMLERVYATVMTARPTATNSVYFSLEPDNATKTALYGQAVVDAARRANLSVEATGAKLGPVKLIDPTGRACETDVLVAGAGRNSYDGLPHVVPSVPVYEAMPVVAPPAPAPAPAAGQQLRPEDMQLPLQAPLRSLEATACVVYSLAG